MSYLIDKNKIVIKEPLVDIENIFELSNKLREINYEKIIIDMLNNYSLPSTIIGTLRLLKDKGKEIEIWVYNDLLYNLLDDLGLKELFNIKKIG